MAVKTAKKSIVKKAPAKKAPAKRKTASGDGYVCGVCGFSVTVDDVCGCAETHDIICCEKSMKRKKAKK